MTFIQDQGKGANVRFAKTPKQEDQILDVLGVGIGPFNLSVAALLDPLEELRSLFFERNREFKWHPGMLLPEASIQVSFLKDSVSLADPRSRFSFLSYLFEKRRLYRFIIADFPKIKRLEFNEYFRWICDSLPNLRFGREVEAIDYDGDTLMVDLGDERIAVRNVILGTGLSPVAPPCAQPYLGPTVFHSGRYLERRVEPAGKRIAVIGGGQSSAELVSHLLADDSTLPDKLFWITKRSNFLPLDETPFVEEYFTPAYSDFYFHRQPETRRRLLEQQKLASDGINPELLEQIYRRLYELEFCAEAGRMFSLHINTELLEMSPASGGWSLRVRDLAGERFDWLDVDLVILATGFEFRVPACLDPLRGRILLENGRYCLREDYSIEWDGPAALKIYAQNAARHCRGVADPNLSLAAWRSATIINSLAGRRIYDIEEASSVFDWPAAKSEISSESQLGGEQMSEPTLANGSTRASLV